MKCVISKCVLFILLSIHCFAAKEIEDELKKAFSSRLGRTDDITVAKVWQKMREELHIDLDQMTSGLASKFDRLVKQMNISANCVKSINDVFRNASNRYSSAIELIDSWGKFPPSGMLTGTVTSYGTFDECLSITSFSTHYCTVQFRFILPMRPRYHNILNTIILVPNTTLDENKFVDKIALKSEFYYYTPFRIGVCLPSECSTDDVDVFANSVGEKMFLKGEALKCKGRESLEEQLTTHQMVALCFFSLIVVMSIIGTLTDHFSAYEKRPSFAKHCLIAFSVKRNISTLLSGKSSNYELKCLNGIRFLTMAWIILGHTAVWIHFQTFSQSFRIVDIITPFYAQALLNATLSVETFFVLSGLLTSYVTWSTTHGYYKNFNGFWYLVSRYVRLTPGLLSAIGATFFLPHLGSGPLWHEVIDPIVNGCKENWWINLLYLQNYVNSEKICLLPSWWLAVDMHFHIISLMVVIALMRRPTVGLFANVFIIIVFTIVGGIVHYMNGYPAAIVATHPQIEEYWLEYVLQYFYKPWVHAAPFFIGLLLGYFLAKRRFLKLSKTEAVVGWTIAIIMLLTVLHTPYYWNIGNTSSKLVAALYDSCNRIFWSLAIAWVIYACSSGYGGLIGRFLSCSAFVPLAKLTFMVYLTHMWLIWCYMATRRELLHTSTYTAFYMFLGHWVLAYVLGFIFSLLFESPFLVLQKVFVQRYQKLRDFDNNNACEMSGNATKSDDFEDQQPQNERLAVF